MPRARDSGIHGAETRICRSERSLVIASFSQGTRCAESRIEFTSKQAAISGALSDPRQSRLLPNAGKWLPHPNGFELPCYPLQLSISWLSAAISYAELFSFGRPYTYFTIRA
jgi:hypothetical protein